MGVELQNDEAVSGFWNELMEENKDVFVTDRNQIFLAMKIAVQCIHIDNKEGLLGMEEFVDNGCGIDRSEIPLWEYLRPSVWLAIEMSYGELKKMVRRALYSLLEAYHYTGYKVIQGFVYMVSAIVMTEGGNARRVLAYFRSLVPEQAQESFDNYFQPVLDEWQKE